MSARETEQPAVGGECIYCGRKKPPGATWMWYPGHGPFCAFCMELAASGQPPTPEGLGAAAGEVARAPIVEKDCVRLQRVVGLLARWRVEVSNYRKIIQNLGTGHPGIDDYAQPANCVESCANDLEAELAGKEPNCGNGEAGSDTPDFIVDEFLAGCLGAFDRAVQDRERWYRGGTGAEGGVWRCADCLEILDAESETWMENLAMEGQEGWRHLHRSQGRAYDAVWCPATPPDFVLVDPKKPVPVDRELLRAVFCAGWRGGWDAKLSDSNSSAVDVFDMLCPADPANQAEWKETLQ